MVSWIICLVGLGVSWHFTDLEAESGFQNRLCPILVAVFLIAILVKFVILLGPDSGRHGGGDGGGSSGGFGGGGDCGGDGC